MKAFGIVANHVNGVARLGQPELQVGELPCELMNMLRGKSL